MAGFHYSPTTKATPQVFRSNFFQICLSLCVTSKAVVSLLRPPLRSFLPPPSLSLSPSSFIQVLAHIEFLSRRSHNLPATLGLHSKEMSIKSRANGRSSA